MPRILKDHVEPEAHAKWPIVAILLLALAVRIWGIGYALPYSLNPEEQRVVKQAFYITATNGKVVEFDKPVFMSYIVAGEYGGVFGVGHIFSKFTRIYEFEGYYLSHPSLFIILARLTSLFFGLLSIYLLYSLGREIFEWGVGLVAAGFLAFLPQHVHFSRLGTGEMLAFMFVVLAMRQFMKLTVEKRLGSSFAGAFMLGLAAAASYQYAYLVALAFIAYLVVVPREYKAAAAVFGLPLVAISWALGLLLPNAMLLLSPQKALYGSLRTFVSDSGVGTLLDPANALGALRALVSTDIFDYSLGWGLVGAGALGILWGLLTAKWRRSIFAILLAALAVSAAFLFPLDVESFARWGMVVAAPLAVGAAFILQRMFWRKGIPALAGMLLITIFAAGIAAQPAAETAVLDQRRSADDTRYQFAQWAQGELPDAAKVLVTPNADYLLERRRLRWAGLQWESWRADILSNWNSRSYEVTPMPVPPMRGVALDLDSINYAAIDSWSVDRLKVADTPQSKSYLDEIDAIRANGRTVKTFDEPKPGLKGAGPRIDVIELAAPAVAPPAVESTSAR